MSESVTVHHVLPVGREVVAFSGVTGTNVLDNGALIVQRPEGTTVFASGFWAYAESTLEDEADAA